jgi:hypothetical protein
MDHFEKLRDCGMMKNFMALGSLVQSMEVDKVPKGVAWNPFLRKTRSGLYMMGAPHQGCAACLTQAEKPQLGTARGVGTQGCMDTNFPISLYIDVCRNIDMYITYTPKAKKRWQMG